MNKNPLQKFLVILNDMEGVPDLLHPTEICGVDKNEVVQIISQDTPRQYIKFVFTPNEYLGFVRSENFKNQLLMFNPGLQNNPQTINQIQNQAVNIAQTFISENNEINDFQNISNEISNNNVQPICIENEIPQINNSNTTVNLLSNNETTVKQISMGNEKPKYFTDNGIQFKLENGEIFKKVWEDVNLEPIKDEQSGEQIIPEIRLISKETGKPVKSTKFGIQKLVWKKLV